MTRSVPAAFEGYAAEELPTPAGSPGKDGRLELTLAPDTEGVTRAVHEYVEVPFHLTRGLYHDPVPGLLTRCIQTPTGGVAQGDRHRTEVVAKQGTKAHVTAQSATKVQSMTRNYARLAVDLEVEEGAYLEYLPEPVILHEGTRCLQTADVTLHEGGTLLFSDVVVPGRLARGECFAYDRYRSRLCVDAPDGTPLVYDALDLAPDERSPQSPGVLGEFAVVGTLYALGVEDPDAITDRIHDRLDSEAHAGVSLAPGDRGVIVRALGERRAPVTDALREAWAAIRESHLGARIPEGRP
ncbi:urease accessory protein UreD [Halalkalicoccus jeotgali]|uniref:Urease accessory protein UreD n=1 Tax=Halalkalicoccus jeotgali (strain DSM 18796 / CECT 7217 / JCM 14584 / KCTC 4019 / B3) TaxID=795797 RepID=D8J7E2_HALJB|nr:urease accessory protein UreD [Halalkalicoccus jeotgali]ADJ14037.1 Urease accessory protein UreD [Halalkalicoccus jeotgali B3]ELY33919.1 Urease accessory protein UreD [Halalkalicoccus jeotgali B3]